MATLRNLIFLLMFSMFWQFLYSRSQTDSLYQVWLDTSASDSLRVEAYDKYIWKNYLYTDRDSAWILASELYDFALERNSQEGLSNALNIFGCVSFLIGDYSEALDYFEQKLGIDSTIGDDKRRAGTIGNMGLVYQNMGEIIKALNAYQNSYEIKKRIDDKRGMANSTSNIGTIFLDKGSFLKALEYQKLSLALEEELGDQRGIAGSLINIGNIYKNIGENDMAMDYYQRGIAICEEINERDFMSNALSSIGGIFLNQRKYDDALDYYERSLVIRKEMNSKRGISGAYSDIGAVYQKRGEMDKALEYFNLSLALRKDIGYKRGIAFSLMDLGMLHVNQKEFNTAIRYCREALSIGELLESSKVLKNACDCLYRSYKGIKNGEIALSYHELKMAYEDSLQKDETMKKLQQMEFEKMILADSLKQEEEKLLVEMSHQKEVRRKNKVRNFAVAGGLLFLLLAGGFFSRWQYVKKSKSIIEKERDRSENLLLNILPHEIAEELKANGKADAKDCEMVTILFTDFIDFTKASSSLSASELVAEINTCFKAFDAIIEKFRIEKIKTIGDAYMAAGGLPVYQEESVKNTVLAALAMQDFISKRKSENRSKGLPAFEMRVGVHSGPVVAGIVGVKKFQYDIWGDTVNIASRMESNGAPGLVNISQKTYALLQSEADLKFENRGKINVKGKGEMEMWFVNRSSNA